MFPPALLHFPICLKVTPSYAAVCRREDASGSFWAFSPGGDLLDADSMGQARLDRFSASGFRGLLVCPLCVGRAVLDTRRHGSSLPRLYRMQPTPPGSAASDSGIFINHAYLHNHEYLQ
jgi:hypothetical protein